MAQKSYWACVLSLRLLRERWPFATSGFLWTLTFADREKQIDGVKAAAAFVPVGKYLLRNGWECLRVMEQGSRGGNWHFHLVTLERRDWHELHKFVTTHGFGVVLHVKEKSLDELDYVAKYVAKNILPGAVRCGRIRRWGCIGFVGCRSCDVRVTVKTLHLVQDTYCGVLWEVGEYRIENNVISTWRIRDCVDPSSPLIKVMNLKPAVVEKITKGAVSGVPCIVGEYRVCDVVSKELADFRTGAKVPRVLVSHTIETTKGSLVVNEWLPPGTDPKLVVAPAKKGDLVLVEVVSMSTKFGAVKINGAVTLLS